MKISHSMPIISVGPDASIYETLREMQTNFIKRIVVSSENKPVGIVTERDINRFLEDDRTSRALDEIPIKHVMKKNVISIVDGVEDHFIQCATRMDTFKIGCVVLVDDEGESIGIVTKTDITKTFSIVYSGKYRVSEYMSKKVVTCRKSDTLKYALSLMNRNDVSRLVVTDENGKPLGLITTNTLLTHSDYFTKGKTRSRDYLIPLDNGDKLKVVDLISNDLITIEEEEDLATAANIMIKNKISGIPVIDKNKNLVGVVSKFDVVKAFAVVGTHGELQEKYSELY